MEECNIRQVPHLSGKVSGNVSMVKIDASDNVQFGVVKGWGAIDPIIRTHIVPNPISGCVKRVRINSLFQCPQRTVSYSKPFTGKFVLVNVDLDLKSDVNITAFPERQELAASNEGCFGICQSKREG